MPASLYDAIIVQGKLRPRLNKSFVTEDKVPEAVMSVLTAENVVDENGTIIIDTKVSAANVPTEENAETLEKEGIKLPRIDENGTDQAAPQTEQQQAPPLPVEAGSETPTETQDEQATTAEEAGKTPTAPVASTAPEPPTPAPTPPAPVVAPTPAPTPPPAPAPAPTAPQPAKPAPAAPAIVETFRSKVPQSVAGMGFPRKNGKTVDIFDLITPHTHTKLVGGLTVPLSAESFKTRGDGAIVARLKELGIELNDFDEEQRQQAISQAADPGLLLEEDEVDEDINLG